MGPRPESGNVAWDLSWRGRLFCEWKVLRVCSSNSNYKPHFLISLHLKGSEWVGKTVGVINVKLIIQKFRRGEMVEIGVS